MVTGDVPDCRLFSTCVFLFTMIPYSDVESDVLDRFSSSNALRNRSQIVRDPHGSYRSGESAPDRPMGAKTARGLNSIRDTFK